jgi:hypothetical protein
VIFLLQLSSYISDQPQKQLVVDVLHDVLKGFSVRVTLIDGNNKKDLVHVGVDLSDNNFLKTHFTWSTDDIKQILVSF